MKYNIKLTNESGRSIDYQASAGFTSPRSMQQLAAKVWGDGAKYTLDAPKIGLYLRDTAKH